MAPLFAVAEQWSKVFERERRGMCWIKRIASVRIRRHERMTSLYLFGEVLFRSEQQSFLSMNLFRSSTFNLAEANTWHMSMLLDQHAAIRLRSQHCLTTPSSLSRGRLR